MFTRLPKPLAISLGWMVHLLTASGLIIGMAAAVTINAGQYRDALLLLVLTIVIDAIDGPLARMVMVKKYIKDFDGTLLDNIVDFITWVFLPCYLMIQAQMLPEREGFIAAAIILICAAYQFCCSDVKTYSSTFKRWPSAWSILVILMFIWQAKAWLIWTAIIACVVLSLIPIYYIHPFQKNRLFKSKTMVTLLRMGTIAFVGSMIYALIGYPHYMPELVLVQQFVLFIYFGLCLYQTSVLVKQ